MPTTATDQERDGSLRVTTAEARSGRVDAGNPPSVSFAAKVGDAAGQRAPSSRSVGHEDHALVGVGPGTPGAMLLGGRAGLLGMNPFPIVGARIHPPLMRADTLSRERLNGWLDQAAMGRIALVVAEAGFGKTTLLGDWARGSSRLTAWYRLDPDDRDWLTLFRHLVAGGRELDPDFAPETYALLMQLGPGGPTRADIQASLVREYAEFGASHPQGLTLILDDYHAVDGSDEVVPTVRALIEQTGPSFSIVIASRSTPRLPLGRLRARGAVSRIGGEALCFDVPETDRLFRDAYHLPIEPDVVDQLVERTEGWAALLSLVRANADGQSKVQVPDLVQALSGGAGDMYDYLAEEVLEHLDEGLSTFLVRASILEELDPAAAAAVTGESVEVVEGLLSQAEELALVLRGDLRSNYEFVPLVREFLGARLASILDAASIRAMHLALAEQFEKADWRIAATHYQRAGEMSKANDVVCRSLDAILGAGQYRAADEVLAGENGDPIVRGILRSRLLFQVGATAEAINESASAVAAADASGHQYLGLAAQNAASIALGARRFELVPDFARQAADASQDPASREMAAAYTALMRSSHDGSLPAIARQLELMLLSQLRRGQLHYAGITSLNLAQLLVWLDQGELAIRRAGDAEQYLQRSSRGYELVSVRLVQAQAQAQLGRWADCEASLGHALDTQHPEAEVEAVLEAAAIAAWFGPAGLAQQIVGRVDRGTLPRLWTLHWRVLDLWLADTESKRVILDELPDEPTASVEVAAGFRWHLTVARARLAIGDLEGADRALNHVDAVARAQRSPIERRLSEVLHAVRSGPIELSRLLASWPQKRDPLLGVFASEVASAIGDLTDEGFLTLGRAARGNSQRWLDPLRIAAKTTDGIGLQRAAGLLDEIGERGDVSLLRDLSRRVKRSGQVWGDALVRRLAPPVQLEDLGPLSVRVDGRQIAGHMIRKKVLALLAFLACQPGGSATPDQILEALWPELQPDQGINSVHQTIYFLRRVIDPDYRAGRSADYLHFDDDIVTLDRDLVDCESWRCRRLLARRPETQLQVEEVLDQYVGKFASDFSYEDWASPYRDILHATFLALMERATTGHVGSADQRWRLWVGQRTLAIDPDADVIEAQVIRLYRAVGAPAAAAEQYAHYASVMREQLGIDVPPLEEV